jgi:hypothetical protein
VRKIVFVFLLTAGVWAAPAVREYSSVELLNLPREYDNIPVLYQGEVIGDIMARGEKVWFNVSDGENALGIFAQRELAAEIKITGKYRQIGDTVIVLGEFNRACSEHGGELDIHARQIEKIAAGYTVTRPVSGLKIILPALLAVIVLSLSVLDRKRKK